MCWSCRSLINVLVVPNVSATLLEVTATFYTPGAYPLTRSQAVWRSRAVGGCTWRHNNVGGVTAGQAPHNSSNVGVVTAGQVGHNSSIHNCCVTSDCKVWKLHN